MIYYNLYEFEIKKLDFTLMNTLTSILNGNENGNFTKSYIDPKSLKEEGWNLSILNELCTSPAIFEGDNEIKLGTFANPSTGLTTGLDQVFLLDEKTIAHNQLERDLFIKIFRGRNIELIRHPYNENSETIGIENLNESFKQLMTDYHYIIRKEHYAKLVQNYHKKSAIGIQ